MCWLLVLMAVVLASVCLVTRNLLRQEMHSDMNAALEQEAREYRDLAAGGVDENQRPFPSVAALLGYHLRLQVADDDEVIAGWVGEPDPQYLYQHREEVPLRLREHPDLLDTIVRSPSATGVLTTPAGDMHWVKVTTTGQQPAAGSGVYVVGYLIDRDLAEVDLMVRTLALVSLVGLVLAGVAAWIVAGQILAPIRLVRQGAEEITEHDLTRRIPAGQVVGNDDIAALAEQFNAMLDRLEQAFATQREFLDDASHELRTPITIVRGHLELLSPDDDPAERAEAIRLCLDELDRMSRIVGDLLLLAKAERPDFVRPEPVELAELTSDVDAKVRALDDRDWRLSDIGTGIVHVDPQRVTQAMVQLAQNAVQHTNRGDRITLGSSRWNNTVSLWVTDTGPGVPAEDLAVIFDRFSRGHGGRAHRGGAGLGLAIVRAIADAHHGTVRVLSNPGSGATFGIELPVDAGERGVGP
ncbi:HAMP domain-containing sensor histidine kinase [Actinophytocola sediminis]